MSSSLEDYPLSLKTMYDIGEFIIRAIKAIKPEHVNRMIDELEYFYKNNRNGKVMVMGAGRSGLVGRAFAMRLLHLGYN
ncbi:MAG: 6-phospho-3-hexuloisomerase, partial [Saccharolobus sp.]